MTTDDGKKGASAPAVFRERPGLQELLDRPLVGRSIESNFDPMQSVGPQLGRPLQYQSVARSVSVWLTPEEWAIIQKIRKDRA